MDRLVFELLKIITDYGYEAYLVGGYPRDHYLGIISTDYDICTSATSLELKQLFNDQIKDVGYGSMILNYNNMSFEITTYRLDKAYLDNRRPEHIEYTDSLIVDLNRRDFIMNTLCMDYHGNYIDHLGAISDLDNRIVRCVGDTDSKIGEDSLRILRAIRFATVLNFKLDKQLLKVIKNRAYSVSTLSSYRKKQELEKIFASPNIEYGISLLKECNLVPYLNLKNLDHLVIVNDIDAIWAQLEVEESYPFTREQKKRINKIKELLVKDILNSEIIYHYGLELSLLVSKIKKLDEKKVIHIFKRLSIKKREDIHINIEEIMNMNDKFTYECAKDILNDIELQIIHNKLVNDNEKIKNYIDINYNKR